MAEKEKKPIMFIIGS